MKIQTTTIILLAGILLIVLVSAFSQKPLASMMQKRKLPPTQKDTTMKPIAEYLKDVYKPGMPKVVKTEAEWKKLLPPETYAVTREAGTERAFCGAFYDHKKEGIYLCACCDLPLFASNAKFDSGTGWPSFFQPVNKDHIAEKADNSYGMKRVEVNCARCDSHLGHVFDDGPRPTGLRYCMNSESLKFVPGEIPAKF
ncbi:MAG: peptide-methionine (R)-S-oxide reductase MsrB [Bacteroidota bacterium]|jgi:methionine-R-sulfoxide reductase